tara:strand:- start:56 stop:883 length:828 start_codon:yes stop_codon:yes gene_type:complete
MPLEYVPENLDFAVDFEPTRMSQHKYVINRNTGEPIAIVGRDFKCEPHGTFFRKVMSATTENLSEYETSNATVKFNDAHNNGWAMMDITLPNVKAEVVTSKRKTEVHQRIIALHGVDGTCSNIVLFGAIDFFCTNGMVTGEHDKIRRKNTSGFNIDTYIDELKKSKQDFYAQSKKLQAWANKPLYADNVKSMLESLDKGKSKRMFELYNQEASVRGNNAFALYSAFTNYATYADERNGFTLRNTGKDTDAKNMWEREEKVTRWVESKQFKELLAA